MFEIARIGDGTECRPGNVAANPARSPVGL